MVNDSVAAVIPRILSNPAKYGIPEEPGWCLAAVRVIVEHAVFGGRWQFYDHFLVAGSTHRSGTFEQRLAAAKANPWAVDLEASVKLLGFAVPSALRRPGDLVFNHAAAAGIGHVGVLWTREVMVEQVDPAFRPTSISLPGFPVVNLTRFGAWPPTLVARLRII